MKTLIMLEQYEKIRAFQTVLNGLKHELGYPELCHNRLDCFCFVLNLVGVEQN